MGELLKSLAPRIAQDLITSGAALLVAHGYITSNQQQDFIGAAFFLIMLVINSFLHLNRQMRAAEAGANTVGSALTAAQSMSIAKTGKPQ